MNKAKKIISLIEQGTLSVIYKKGKPIAIVQPEDVPKWFSGHNLNYYSVTARGGEYEVKEVSSEEALKIKSQMGFKPTSAVGSWEER